MEPFRKYQKSVPTWAVQLPRDATIITREGEVQAKEGDYLDLDASGYPYPIEEEEFERMYDLVEKDD